MERIYGPGEWIASQVKFLTDDDKVRDVFQAILTRTIGQAADEFLFPYDRYYAPDGVGRPEKVSVIGQWLCVEARTNSAIFDDPSFEELVAQSDLDGLWQHAQARLMETGFTELLPKSPSDEVEMLEYADGHKLVALLTHEAVRNEAHSSGMFGGAGEKCQTWVLRDDNHASVAMLVVVDDEVVSMAGFNGKRVPFHVTQAYFIDIIKSKGLRLADPVVLHGAVQTADGAIYDLRDIPDGSTVNGSLWINREGHLLSRLPSDLTVNGDFGIYDSAWLTETPRNLVVEGNCGFTKCPGLRVVKSGLRVKGYTYFNGCDQLKSVEDNVDFGLSVDIRLGYEALSSNRFRAQRVSFANEVVSVSLEGDRLPRDDEGRVIVNGGIMKKALRRKFQSEIASIPAVLVGSVLSDLKRKLRYVVGRKVSKIQKQYDAPKSDDDGWYGPSP